MIKNSLKILSFIIIILSVMLCSGFEGLLCHATNTTASYQYDASQTNENSIVNSADNISNDFFSYVTFSSEGMIYDEENFVNNDYVNNLLPYSQLSNSTQYIGAIYANTNITISPTITETSSVSIELTPLVKYVSFNEQNNCYNYAYVQSIDESIAKPYKDLTVLTFDESNPVIMRYAIKILYTHTQIDINGNPTKITTPKNYMFTIIQISDNYSTTSPVSYNYTPKNGTYELSVSTLQTGETYKTEKINLKLNKIGTPINPVYIHFVNNGESYIIYNIDGKFYNDLSRTDTNSKNSNSPITELENNTIPFNKSGIYEIEIYDNLFTHSGKNTRNNLTNPNSNIKTDSFLLETDSTMVYLTAQSTKTNMQIATGQPTNDNVNVTIYNMSTSNVQSLVLTKYSTATYHSSTETYSGDKLQNNVFSLTEDYVYTFQINYISSLTNKDKNKYQTFTYVIPIVKNIRSSYTKIDTQEVLTANGSNTIQDIIVEQDVELTYGHGIKCEYIHSYSVRLANSNPSINGIANNGLVDGEVKLTLYGVGNLTVTINQNGSTQTQVLENGSTITLNSAGKYYVEVTDQMNTKVAKSFNIGVSMNTATIFLIIIGVLLLAGIILFIIKNRSRMSVK